MSEGMQVLTADVGGTYVRFALAHSEAPGLLVDGSVQQLEVAAFSSLIEAGQQFLSIARVSPEQLGAGVLAVAGRVEGDFAQMTNHPWRISATETAAAFGLPVTKLVNDFTAQALAVEHLRGAHLQPIGHHWPRAEASESATFDVLGPGTGLGVSAFLRRDGLSLALESEGGHSAFAPSNEHEAAVRDLLATKFGRVSYERLLSGAGLANIEWALATLAGQSRAMPLAPAAVTQGAREGNPTCCAALAMFCSVFGAFAGDLVLTLGAWDGVFLSGGLVPRLLNELQQGDFRRAFENKGRFSAAMASVPTLAVTHTHAGLDGAAAMALKLLPQELPATSRRLAAL